MTRRQFLMRGSSLGLAALWLGPAAWKYAQQGKTPMVVYMDPGCGCCSKWVSMAEAAGFAVSAQKTTDIAAIKRRYGIGDHLLSCHTALVGGYLVEGHVPFDLVRKVLAEKPKIKGLAVPGMVTGSPGMEGPNPQPYEVLAFDAAGKTTLYARR
ncbi:MAG: DUF411 domain-containing protein [Gemmatimonadales bacterium]